MPDFGDFSFPSAPGLTREQLLAWYADHPSIDSPGTGAFTPPNPPQAIPGALPGVLSPMGAGGAQGAPAGHPGMLRGLLDRMALLRGGQTVPFLPALAASTGQTPGIPPSGIPNVPLPAPQQPPPELPPTSVSFQPPQQPSPAPPAPQGLPSAFLNPNPTPGAPGMQAANAPQPQQPPPIPPASAAGRTAAAQPQGNPLDQYFQQMMALQRQRMLLGMAGGLLGAPSLGIGLGRAFTNASNTVAPEGDLVTKIAQAQIAGQLERQKPYSTPADVQAAELQAFVGKPPEFKQFDYKGQTFGQSPAGRNYSLGTGLSAWAHEMGFKTADGQRTDDYTQAGKQVINGKTYYRMSDDHLYDPTAPTAEAGALH